MGIEFSAEALDRILDTAAEARGIDITLVGNDAGGDGLPDQIPLAVVHGKSPQILGLKPIFDAWRTRPERKQGIARMQTLAAFIALTNRHATPHSAVFANVDWRQPSLTAVIDYHEIDLTPDLEAVAAAVHVDGEEKPTEVLSFAPPRPDNLKHRIVYDYPLSDDWKAWIGNDGEVMDQRKFAAWFEDRIGDLAAPSEAEVNWLAEQFQTTIATPAQVVSMTRGLKINVAARYKSEVNLQSGADQIMFEETHQDADGKPVTVPGLFMLAIAPFFSGEKVRVPVRLRYRPADGKVVWWYQIFRPDLAITERLDADLARIATETDLPVYEGAPEA
jgi:hypothetical protein